MRICNLAKVLGPNITMISGWIPRISVPEHPAVPVRIRSLWGNLQA
jgi:hypothetical protein